MPFEGFCPWIPHGLLRGSTLACCGVAADLVFSPILLCSGLKPPPGPASSHPGDLPTNPWGTVSHLPAGPAAACALAACVGLSAVTSGLIFKRWAAAEWLAPCWPSLMVLACPDDHPTEKCTLSPKREIARPRCRRLIGVGFALRGKRGNSCALAGTVDVCPLMVPVAAVPSPGDPSQHPGVLCSSSRPRVSVSGR